MYVVDNFDNDIDISKPFFLTIGVFDGVHKAHFDLINRAVSMAKKFNGYSAILTFSPQPRDYFQPDVKNHFLTTLSEQKEIFNNLGVNYLFLLKFNKELSEMSPADFLHFILLKVKTLKCVIIGDDWRFGHKRSGDLIFLKKYLKNHDIETKIVPAIKIKNKLVKSSFIRELIKNNNFNTANKLLLENFFIKGEREKGRSVGEKIGFPTINISFLEGRLPLNGVYVVKVLGNYSVNTDNNTKFSSYVYEELGFGLVNIGMRPTFKIDNNERKLELYLFNFLENYNICELKIIFLKFLRKEKKFKSIKDLQCQIKIDCDLAKKFIEKRM